MHNSKILILNAILVVCLVYVISCIPIDSASATLEIGNSTEAISYLPYSNQELGIAFEYPSDWKVSEKTSRFSSEPDVTVSSGLNSLKYISDKFSAGESGFFDLELIATMAQNELTNDLDTRLVESVDLDKYQINGKDTATFLIKTESSFGESSFLNLDYATQVFIIDNGDTFDTLMYQDTVARFDTPESQEKLNHILNSFVFGGSDENNESDTNNEEDNDNEDN